MVTWFEATHEVCALVGGGRYPDAFILLGKAPSFKSLEAVLVDRPGPATSVVWVAEMVDKIPGEDATIEELVSAYDERLRVEAEEDERRHLASFEVIDLCQLPRTEACETERHGEADWVGIARIAVDLLETGISPCDQSVITSRGQLELNEEDCGLLWSLFCDPIAITGDRSVFINGRHRTASMRATGVTRSVVHTDRGYA